MHQILRGQALHPMFKNGTVLWRHCFHHVHKGVRVEPMTFDKTEKGTYLGRIQLGGGTDFTFEPVVIPNSYDDQGSKIHCFGIVVFIDKMPPEDWTHLLVTGVSKAMRTPGTEKGHAVFATPAKPYPMDEYRRFRGDMARLVHNNLNATFEQKKQAMLNCWPNEVRPTECRLLAQSHWKADEDDKVAFDFCHLRQLPETTDPVVQTGIVTMKAK